MTQSQVLAHGERIVERILEGSQHIRYAALYVFGVLTSRHRAELVSASSSESDKYEELLVNPVLLKIVSQRGDIDCGGAKYVLVRYGNFQQLVIALPEGHVSVCFELEGEALPHVDEIYEICTQSVTRQSAGMSTAADLDLG